MVILQVIVVLYLMLSLIPPIAMTMGYQADIRGPWGWVYVLGGPFVAALFLGVTL